MVKIQKVSGSLLVTIPAGIASAKGWKQGDEAEWILDNMGNLILRKKQP